MAILEGQGGHVLSSPNRNAGSKCPVACGEDMSCDFLLSVLIRAKIFHGPGHESHGSFRTKDMPPSSPNILSYN